ncbi:Fanconi anaemia protein FANCD2 [Gigaspora rosea]|uniref:Fanconi anaemia protein FANCD2 n=1 Tax=Gigaspora rosea TaxID=44941 RepID=A0A397UMR7_9GLOM|nr:Fanconi anaemia protein FANCD2 [Gigaspora rosea]
MAPAQKKNKSLFHTFISEAGLKLEGHVEGVHELTVEPSIFRFNLIQKIKSHPQYPDKVIDMFLNALQEYLSLDDEKFKACLQPPSVNGKSIYDSTSDSLIRILLSIDFFQTTLVDQLLERLPTFISESDHDIIESPIPQLILKQLKWLDNIVNPPQLTEKILEMIPITPLGIQKEIITSLPDIIIDSEQKAVIRELIKLIDNDYRLIVPILDALPHFTLEEDLMCNVQKTVFDRLESADLDDLAVVVKFLLQTSSPDDAYNVVQQIREKVDFHSIGELQNEALNSKKHQKRKKEQIPEALILDSIKLGIDIHKFVKDAWLKAISDVNITKNHKIIDILILLILHSIPSTKKKVETIFHKKIVSGLFTPDILENTIKYHFEGLREYFSDILLLSECLLRSSQQQTTVSRAACTLYRSAFLVFEPYQQQEIVASLVTHIGCGSPIEIESALSVLSHLVRIDIKKMSRFAIFVKGLLDYLDNLNIDQIRILFDVISKLVYEDANYDGSNGGLLAEFSIVIQKQLSNPNEKYKQIGVIGALALVQTLGSTQNTGNPNHEKMISTAIESFSKIERYCARSMTCLAFAYDELAWFISNGMLERSLVDWIYNKVENMFSDTYIIDNDDLAKLREDHYYLKEMPIEVWFGVDNDADDSLKFNVYPMLCEPHVSQELRMQHLFKRDHIICCCSMLRLVQACLNVKGGSLTEIGALLSTGLLLYEKVDIERMKSDDYSKLMRETACDALFYSINWCRELVNDFWGSDVDNQKNVISKLRHVIELEKLLNDLLEITPSFQPFGFTTPTPTKNVKSNAVSVVVGSMPKNFIKTGATVRRSGVSKSKIISTRRSEVEKDDEQNKGTNESSNCTPKFASVSDLRPLMRELVLPVFGMLKYGNIKNPTNDNEATKMVDDAQLRPAEIVYLLEDLKRKLDFKLSSPVSNVPFFAKKSKKAELGNNSDEFALIARQASLDIVKQVSLDYVPHLLRQLDLICEELNPTDDVIIEDDVEEALQRCLQLILEIIHRLLCWTELKSLDNKETLITVLKQLCPKALSSVPKFTLVQPEVLQQSANEAFQYLHNFASRLPTANLAILLHKILKIIAGFAPNSSELFAKSGEVARNFASHTWDDINKLDSESIIYLVRNDIRHSSNPIDRIKFYAIDVLPSLESRNDNITESYPLLNRNTFPHFYKALFIELVEVLQEFRSGNFNTIDETLAHISNTVECLQKLVSFIRINHKRNVLSVTLKYGRSFIDTFLKQMLPLMDKHFNSYRDEILNIFKTFQMSTRNLQALCNHVKVNKESQLSAMVPLVKKSLEIVIFQVKGLIQHNGLPLSTFFLGELKHRDIDGREVESDDQRDDSSQKDDVNSVLDEDYDDDGDDKDVENLEEEEEEEENNDAEDDDNESSVNATDVEEIYSSKRKRFILDEAEENNDLEDSDNESARSSKKSRASSSVSSSASTKKRASRRKVK